MLADTVKPSTWEVETVLFVKVPGQPQNHQQQSSQIIIKCSTSKYNPEFSFYFFSLEKNA